MGLFLPSPGSHTGVKGSWIHLGEGRQTSPQLADASAPRLPLFGSRKHSISYRRPAQHRKYFLCCAGLLLEALECFLLRSWLSRLLRQPTRTAEWAYSYLLPGLTRGGLWYEGTRQGQRWSNRWVERRTDSRIPVTLERRR